jgi:hypothetical protein
MDTSTELQASGITNASDAKPSDVSVDSGYETATMNPSTEIPESLPPESPRLLVEKENDSLSKGSGLQSPPMSITEETPIKQDSIDISDTREKDDDVTSMEKRLIKLENELRELKSGKLVPCFSTHHSQLTHSAPLGQYLQQIMTRLLPPQRSIVMQTARLRLVV